MSLISRVFIKTDNKFMTALDITTFERLPPGTYQGNYNPRTEQTTYEAIDSVHDGIVDLPTVEFIDIVSDVDMFFSPGAVSRFDEMNLTHKYNLLLYGAPGCGKSVITRRIINKVIRDGGIALVNPNIRNLHKILEPINSIQPDTKVLVILEEFEEEASDYERELLNLLDGPQQMKNVMYIATTNYLDQVPKRMMRPGRFSNTIEIKSPGDEARRFYLSQKFTNTELVDKIVSMTKDFTIDELKEVVKQHYCLSKDLKKITDSIRKNPSRFIADEKQPEKGGDDD